MGIGIGAIIAAVSAVATYAGEHALLTAVIVGALQAGLSYTISALTAPKPPGPLSTGIDRIRNIQRDPQAPGRVFYGYGFGSGYLVYTKVTNQKGRQVKNARYLHACLVVAVGPIVGITKFHLNDEDDLNKIGDLASFVPFVGSWDQPMFKGPVGIRRKQVELPEEWLAENRPLSGIAYVWCTFAAHPTVFPGGPPQIRFEIAGSIIYDPRSPSQNPDDPYTWEFSNNWAVCVYDYLTNKDYGRGARHNQICMDCFLESAAWSDTPTDAPSQLPKDADPNTPMPQIPRYTVDGSFETNEQPVDIMTTLAAAAAGTITFYDGLWHIRAGQPRATMLDMVTGEKVILTADNLRDDDSLQINVRPGRKEAANIVRGSYVNPKDKFTVGDFPEQTHPDFVREDGGIDLITNLELPYCLDVDRAQRLARISLYMGRLGMRVTFPGGPELLQIPPWEVIELAFPEYGWGEYDIHGIMQPSIKDPTAPADAPLTYKQFYVVDRHFNENGGINLMLAEYSNAMYSDTIDPALLPDRSSLPDPFEVFPPENVTVIEIIHKNPDGTKISKLHLTWEPPVDGYADFYIVTWRNVDGVDPFMSRTVPGDMLMTDIFGLEVGQYEIHIQTRVLNRLSAIVKVFGKVTYDSIPPPAPMNFRVSLQVTGTRQFTWDIVGGVEPADLRGYEIRFVKNTTIVPAWDDARIFLRNVRRRVVETRQPVAEGQYIFLIKSLDTGGTYSEKFAFTQVYISPRESTDLANREYSEELWPGERADCTVTVNNQLAGQGTAKWNTAGTWADMDTWAKGAAKLTYTPPPIFLVEPDFATFEFKVEGQGVAGYYVQARVLTVTGDGLTEFTPFKFLNGASGRGFQFRLIAWNDGVKPLVIDKFYVTLRAKDETDQISSLSVPHTTPILRFEDTAALQSTGQVTHINATPTGITLDVSTWMRTQGSAYILLPTIAEPILFNESTIEITVHINNVTQAGRIIGRGSDWSVDYTYETVGAYSQGTFRFNASGYEVGYPPMVARIGRDSLGVHEIALVVKSSDVTGNTFSFYVDQKLVGTWAGVAFVPSADPVAIAARSRGGVVDSIAQIDAKECRIWRVALTVDQLRAYSGISVDAASPDLIGYWRLDDDFTATTVVRDRTVAVRHGTTVGAVARVRVGSRLSPVIDLAIIPKWNLLRGSWQGLRPAGTGLTVYMGIGQGDNPPAQYRAIPNPNAEVTIDTSDVLPAGTLNPVGYKLWCLQTLVSLDIAQTPTLSEVMTGIYHAAAPTTDVVIPPPHPFSVIRQVSLSVRSTATVPIGWNLIAIDPVAARFSIYNSTTGAAATTTVDVLFQGSRIYS